MSAVTEKMKHICPACSIYVTWIPDSRGECWPQLWGSLSAMQAGYVCSMHLLMYAASLYRPGSGKQVSKYYTKFTPLTRGRGSSTRMTARAAGGEPFFTRGCLQPYLESWQLRTDLAVYDHIIRRQARKDMNGTPRLGDFPSM